MGRVDIYPTTVQQGPPSAQLGYAEVTSSQTGISAETDLTGLAVTVTVPAGRRIRITGQIQAQSATTSGTVLLRLKEGATVLQTSQENYNTIGGNGKYLDISSVISPSAGTHTYKLSLQGTAGTIDSTPGATNPAFILVEDVTGTLWNGTTVTSGMVASEAWTDFSLTWTQGATVTYTTSHCRYIKFGRMVHVVMRLDATGAGTATTALFTTLPVNAFFTVTEPTLGAGFFYDASANLIYPIHIQLASATQIRFRGVTSTANADFGVTGSPFALAIASGDILSLGFTYESAT